MDDAGKTCVTASLTDFCTLTHKSTENLAIYEKENSHVFFFDVVSVVRKTLLPVFRIFVMNSATWHEEGEIIHL